ncbi:MAG: hypothetical protein HZA16_09165 [Nitrospirae bacterium]|nr:hypothetical protein [Nitrospirota bacterium]
MTGIELLSFVTSNIKFVLHRFPGAVRTHINKSGLLSVLALSFVLLFCFTSYAEAGMVYGTVSEKGKKKTGSAFKIKRGETEVNVMTDGNGSYSVFLPQTGIYTVVFPDSGTGATIISQPEPIRQDIDLK